MEENKNIWGILILIFLFFIVFSGNLGIGFGGRGVEAAAVTGGCDRVSNCEIERQEIIDTYNTQLNTINQGNITRAEMSQGFKTLGDQAAGIYNANQTEKIFDLKMENQSLKQLAVFKDEFCALNRRLDGMPIAPPYYARGFVPDGQCVPQNCGPVCGVA